MECDSIKKHPVRYSSLISIFSLVMLVLVKFLEKKYGITLNNTIDLILVAIIYIPLLVIVLNLKEAKFPGLELKFDEIKKAQEAQSIELEAIKNIAKNLMKTAVMYMIKPQDITALTVLEKNEPLPVSMGTRNADESQYGEILERLKNAGLIAVRQALQASDNKKDSNDISITEIGKFFLENYAKEGRDVKP